MYDPSTRPQTAGYWDYLGCGIIVKESWSRSHGRGIIEEHHGIDITGKESWERGHGKRHHGKGIMGEESWKEESWEESWERNHGKRNHGKGIIGGESWEEAPQRFPGGPQEAPRRLPGGSQGNQGSKRPLREGRAILYWFLLPFLTKLRSFVTFTRGFWTSDDFRRIFTSNYCARLDARSRGVSKAPYTTPWEPH